MINRMIEKIMNNADSQKTNVIHLPWKTITQIRNRTTSTNVIRNNLGTEDVKSKEAQNTKRQLGDHQKSSKGSNKEETEIEASTSSKAVQNTYIYLENRTGTNRTTKSQRNCPKPENDDFLWN
jgi:hypothetical protein